MCMQFTYSRLDLIAHATGALIKFDQIVCDKWSGLHDAGKLRYRLPYSNTEQCAIISGAKWSNYLILTVPERFTLRRKPMEFHTLDDPLDGGFNFNLINPEECLLRLSSTECAETEPSLLLTNVSPFTLHHCLFVPKPSLCWNQRLRKTALRAAVECFLLSNQKYLCMGFNSLLAYASVNHLHFHMWPSPVPLGTMLGDTRPKNELECYEELVDHPVHNFVFHLNNIAGLDEFIASAWKVIETCQSTGLAHNLLLTRALDHGNILRLILWPRRSIYGRKRLSAEPVDASISAQSTTGYNVAVAELAGMFVVGSAELARQMASSALYNVLGVERLPVDLYTNLIDRLR